MINKIKQSIVYILIGTLGVIGLAKSAGSSQDAVPKELTPEDKKLVDTVRAVGDFDLSQERWSDIQKYITEVINELHYAFMLEKNRVEKILPREGLRLYDAETWSDYWNHEEGRPNNGNGWPVSYGERFIKVCCEQVRAEDGKPPLTDFQVLEELKEDGYTCLTMADLEYKKFILSGLWYGYRSTHGDIYPFEHSTEIVLLQNGGGFVKDVYTAKPLGTKPLIPYLRAVTLLAPQLGMQYGVISAGHFNKIIDNILPSLRKDDNRYEDLRTLDQKVNNIISYMKVNNTMLYIIPIKTKLAITCKNFYHNQQLDSDMTETHNPWYLSLSNHCLLNQDASPALPVELL